MSLIGPLQTRVMNHIWKNGGECTVDVIHRQVNGEINAPQLAYTTILTVMRNLVKANVLEQHRAKPGERKHTFTTRISKSDYQQFVIKFVTDQFFGGDKQNLISAISSGKSI